MSHTTTERSVRHSELATAVESGSTELAVFALAFMLDDRLQELTRATQDVAKWAERIEQAIYRASGQY